MATVCSTVGNTVGNTTGDTVGTAIGENNRFSICSDPLLDCLCRKRWCDSCLLAFRRNEIVDDILNEEAF